MTACRLILPLALALLSGACADTGASLREALNAAGRVSEPADPSQTTVRPANDAAPITAAAGDLATRVATRPFFVAEPLATGEPLPDAPIPRAEFPAIQLSDALLYLLRNVTLRLAVDANLEDQALTNLVLDGSFADALAQLAQKGNFIYRRQKDVLHIEAAARYRVALPPVGYVGLQGSKAAGVSALSPFDDLVSRLKKAGARNVSIADSENRILFETSIPGRTPVLEALDAFRQREEMIAWKVRVLRLKPGPLLGKSWTMFSPDLKPLALEGRPGDVRAYAGRFDAAAIAAFLKALKQDSAPVEKGVALLPTNLPISFSPSAALCPAAKGRKPNASATVTLQTRRDGRKLRTNLSAVLPGCAASDASMAFTAAASQSIVLAGLGGDLVLILEPQLIRFAGAED